MAQRPSFIGQQLGNYRLISLLGEGGFAKVYLFLSLMPTKKGIHDHGRRQKENRWKLNIALLSTVYKLK